MNCWPSDQRGQTHCNLEYELGDTINELNDLVISIPIPGSATRGPEVLDVVGETSFDSRNMLLHWRIDQVERAKNPSGAMEFALPAAPHESFFPIYVKTSAPQTYCGIEVLEVLHTESGAPMKYSKEVTLKVESEDYTIGA